MEIKLELACDSQRLELFGPADVHLRAVCLALDVKITSRGAMVTISGSAESAKKAADILDKMQRKLLKNNALSSQDVEQVISQLQRDNSPQGNSEGIVVYSNKKVIEPFTQGQLHYIRTIRKNDLTFCTGPAGTGKTFLAVAAAVSMLKRKQIRKIILARPAVEAGEKLGFLPGDLQAKVNPYLRPLFDSLEDMMDFAQMRKFIEMDIIEVIPLAFMRGRTLNCAAVICDEAQNTSVSQMMMFLTRLGRGSKMIVTGDITQIDLEKGQSSGMIDATRTLSGIKGIGFTALDKADIVRHNLVQQIVQAYDDKNKKVLELDKTNVV